MIDQADEIIEPITESLDKGKLSDSNRNKLWFMREQLIKIKQTGTLWVVGKIAVNNKSISLNVAPGKVSSYGKNNFKKFKFITSRAKGKCFM